MFTAWQISAGPADFGRLDERQGIVGPGRTRKKCSACAPLYRGVMGFLFCRVGEGFAEPTDAGSKKVLRKCSTVSWSNGFFVL